VADVLADTELDSYYGWFVLHETGDDWTHPPDDCWDPVTTARGSICVRLVWVDADDWDEVPFHLRVLRGPDATGPGELVYDERTLIFGTGLAVPGSPPRSPAVMELGGPGRLDLRIHLDTEASPIEVTVVLGELEPDRSLLPPVPLGRRLKTWWRPGADARGLGRPR
jgi:hypothetical protein